MKKIIIVLLLLFALLLSSCTQNNNQTTKNETLPETQKNEQTEVTIVKTSISSITKYGNIALKIKPTVLLEYGFETADIINVKIGNIDLNMPVGTSFNDVDSGEAVCRLKMNTDEEDEVTLAINSGNFASTYKIAKINKIDTDPGYEWVWENGYDETTIVYLSMVEKQGFADEYKMHQLGATRTNKRADYSQLNDTEYANFRYVKTTGIAPNVLFRSSSPINPSLNRNKEADAAIIEFQIKTIINLTDSEELTKDYPEYASTNYSNCNIIFLNMGMDYTSNDYKEKLAQGYKYMSNNTGPYLIHCTEGKDRTGFAIGILECLMGATPDEIVTDYMLTYYNFYGITTDSEQYTYIAESNIKTSLSKAFNIESIDNKDVNLSLCAEKYLKEIGLSDSEITSLKNNLSK